jgi:hypothetical protein
MPEENQHGLSRYIPADVKREIRQRSKFGCVICRKGFYQYEHIDPPFEDAKTHDPDHICCLCASCHDSVTRGQLSKQAVSAAYEKIRLQQPAEAGPPVGPLDFHDGTAELVIGGLSYSPVVRSVLRYHGWDLIQVIPGAVGEPGRISAVFTDRRGDVTLQLIENEWVGSLENWDIEIVGQRITVRPRNGEISLRLRLDPPGRIIIERLDMRFRGCHVLATEHTYAAGRYITDTFLRWVHANIRINRSSAVGAVIEFTDQESLEVRHAFLQETGAEMATADRSIIMHAVAGVMAMPLGISIASLTGSFDISEYVTSQDFRLDEIRPVVFNRPDKLTEFMATGKIK